MKAILVRVGVDQTYGHWNAPVDPESGRFIYVPIPEKQGTPFRRGLEKSFEKLVPTLAKFAAEFSLDLNRDLGFPRKLLGFWMHLDPDFEWLTYGDNGDVRGAAIKNLREGDLLVFYAGLKSVRASRRLIYALVGLYVIKDVVNARDIPSRQRRENAHTRKLKIGAPDIVVRAKKRISGRLTRCIPIGEWRSGAYRVKRELLSAWGDLEIKDRFIQRSVRPPMYLAAERFYTWFKRQGPQLIAMNNP